jgi:hypothetical protein
MESGNDSLSRVRDLAEMDAILTVNARLLFLKSIFILLRLLDDDAHALAEKPLFQTRSDFYLALIQLVNANDSFFLQDFNERIKERSGFEDAVGVGIGAAFYFAPN